jgi:hypothetical protein
VLAAAAAAAAAAAPAAATAGAAPAAPALRPLPLLPDLVGAGLLRLPEALRADWLRPRRFREGATASASASSSSSGIASLSSCRTKPALRNHPVNRHEHRPNGPLSRHYV